MRASTMKLDVAEGIAVGALTGLLKERYPVIQGLTSFAIAVNGSYATADTIIHVGDEVAIIPPVSGG